MLERTLQRQRPPLPAGPDQRQLINRLRARHPWPQQAHNQDEDDLDPSQENTRTIANAGRLLSQELYTKDDHVMLELVQNADDCAYAEGVVPAFQLILFENALLVASNERGFEPGNVKAICNLGDSSKSRSLGAFTGEKGIGFKAVAIISQATYIDSGGFNFMFDLRPESYTQAPQLRWIGLVQPTWVENLSGLMEENIINSLAGVDGIDAAAVLADLEGYGTCMWLDLKPDCDRQRLAQQLESLSPFMLLNLRKLRHIRVLIATKDKCYEKKMSSAEQGNFVTITEQEGLPGSGGSQQERKHHLLCLQKTILVPEHIGKSEEKREGVQEVALMFALPMEEDRVTACPDEHAGLFAFLPVAPYGFRYNIQADFVLPSSREGILEDRAWNKWMRDELAPAFVAEVLRAMSTGTLSCAALLQFLPLPGEVLNPFLAQAAASMLKLLQQKACVLAASGQYRQPTSTILPEPLLHLSDGQPLITNAWLQAGLSGREYVHADVLGQPSSSSSSSSRSSLQMPAVLRALGASRLSTEVLVQWLTAEETARVLQQLPEAARTSWLQSLHVCLNRLTAQVHGPLSLADAAKWKGPMSAAPILPVLGQVQPISHQAAASQGKLYLWDPAFGSAADASLFSEGGSSGSSSSKLLFIDPTVCAARPEVEAVLQHPLFGVQKVPMSVLVEAVLQQQSSQPCNDSRHQQRLLFLMRNRQHLGPAHGPLWQKLQGSLQLRTSSGGYSAAAKLRYPCSCAGQVPAELQQDLIQGGGLQFLHSWCEQLLSTGSDTVSADDARSFLNTLGVRELSVETAVKALLQLYESVGSLAAVRMEQHLRHVSFMAAPAAQTAVGKLSKEISSSLRLYSHTQNTGSESPKHVASQLFAPLSKDGLAASITSQLTTAGAQFIHGRYCTDTSRLFSSLKVSSQDLGVFLSSAAGVKTGANEVVKVLTKLHSDAGTLRAAARSLALRLDNMLVQQLQFIAARRTSLTDSVQQLCKQKLMLLDSSGELVGSSNLQLPPADTATLQILQNLIDSGSSVRMLSSSYAPICKDAESRLVLTQLLGLQQADAATTIRSIVEVHSSSNKAGGTPMSDKQRLQHLEYLAQQKHLLEADQNLCGAVQQAVRLEDMAGSLAAANGLFFPLASHLAADLQEDMHAAGMRFLRKRYTGQGLYEPHSSAVLRLLGVSTATESVIAEHVLKLHPDGQHGVTEQQRRRVTEQQLRRHLSFFADNIRLLKDDSLLQRVKDQVQLQDSQGCYRAADGLHHGLSTQFASLQTDMLDAGMHFLHSSYLGGGSTPDSSSSTTTTTTTSTTTTTPAQQQLMMLLQLLGVATPDFGVVTRYLLRLYQGDAAAMPVEQHLRHIDFLAQNITLLEKSRDDLLQDVRQHVLLWDAAGRRRLAKDLYFGLGEDTAELQADMVGAGMRFVCSSYHDSSSSVSSAVRKQLLSVLGIQQPDKRKVASHLVQLHKITSASAITEQQRCRHMTFLAVNIWLLDPSSSVEGGSLLQLAQQHMHLQAVDGSYLPAKQLWFPPKADEADLFTDLAAAGMSFIHEQYGGNKSVSSDQQARLLQLLELLGIKRPSSDDVAEYLAKLHEAGSLAVSEQQRNRHLAFFAANLEQLQPGTLKRLQKHLLLQDSAGNCRSAGELMFPLSAGMSNLQASMDDAGMPFLHSSYTDAAARTGRTAHTLWQSSRQSLVDLLFELGVQQAGADMVAAHILKLYPPATAAGAGSSTDAVLFDQHMAHMQFFCSQWGSLAATTKERVRRKLQLRLQAGCSRAVSTADSGSPLFLLPPRHTTLAGMLHTLQQGGALFLAQEYSTAATCLQGGVVWSELQLWFRTALSVDLLSDETAAEFILSAHRKPAFIRAYSRQQVILQGLFVAAVAVRLPNAAAIRASAKQHLQLVLHSSAPLGRSSSSGSDSESTFSEDAAAADDSAEQFRTLTAAEGLTDGLYWPAKGGKIKSSSWQLQDILLPSEVPYIHPEYIPSLQHWQASCTVELSLTVAELQAFFTQHLGLRVCPVPGSKALQAAVAAGNRWRPLLLMLSDTWSSSYWQPRDQELLQQQLQRMEVESSVGRRPLSQCFLLSNSISSVDKMLLHQLQLPVLDLQLPASSKPFLEKLGVSTELNLPTLLKILQQLLAAEQLTGTDSDTAAMQRLYQLVYAQALQGSDAAATVRRSFEQLPLLFVAVRQQRLSQDGGSAGQDPKGYWVTCKDVMWSGNRRIFPHKTFIAPLYKGLEGFFCQQLGIRDTDEDDLKEALEHMSQQSVSADTAEIYLAIIKKLAGSASSLQWLPGLLKTCVLLTHIPTGDGPQLQFVASTAAPYIPDHPKLVEQFGQDCSLLAVPTEEVPGLQPLLQQVQPPLRSLSRSVLRSYTIDRDTEAYPDQDLTLLVQQAVKLAARYVYTKAPQHYQQLLVGGQLQKLVQMGAYSAPGLLEKLSLHLPDGTVISKQLPAGAAVSEVPVDADVPVKVMLVNTADTRGSQHRAIAASLAELLCCGTSSSSVSGTLQEPLSQQLKVLLTHVREGEVGEAERDLQESGVGEIPRDKRPWLLPGEAASDAASGVLIGPGTTGTQLWADDGDDLSDTGSSAGVAAEALAAAQARARAAADHMGEESAAATVATAAAAATPSAAAARAAASSVAATVPNAAAAAAAGSVLAVGMLMSDSQSRSSTASFAASGSSISTAGMTALHPYQDLQGAKNSFPRPTTGNSSCSWLLAGGRSGRGSSTGQQRTPTVEAHTAAGSSGGSNSGDNSGGSSGGSRGSSGSSRPFPSNRQRMHFTESTSLHRSRSLRFTEEGSFAFAAPAPAPDEFSDSSDAYADMMRQALSAGEAAGSRGIVGTLRPVYQRPAGGAGLPSPPWFIPSPLGFVSAGQHDLQTPGFDQEGRMSVDDVVREICNVLQDTSSALKAAARVFEAEEPPGQMLGATAAVSTLVSPGANVAPPPSVGSVQSGSVATSTGVTASTGHEAAARPGTGALSRTPSGGTVPLLASPRAAQVARVASTYRPRLSSPSASSSSAAQAAQAVHTVSPTPQLAAAPGSHQSSAPSASVPVSPSGQGAAQAAPAQAATAQPSGAMLGRPRVYRPASRAGSQSGTGPVTPRSNTSSTHTNSSSSRNRSSGRSNPHAAAPEGAEHAGDAAIGAAVEGIAAMGPVQRTGRIEHSIEVRQELHQTVTQTRSGVARFTVSGGGGVSSSRRPAGSFGSGTGRSSSSEYAERIGTAGEVFLFGWLGQRLSGFSADNWCSGNRVHLPGTQQLQPPSREPSFDFIYTDADGQLTGEPGTLCYIECKATSADLSSQLMPIAITSREWDIAQRVHAERLAGGKCQYILFRVDRVGQPGGPRVAAMLVDPVQLLAEGQLCITGEELRIEGYALLKLGTS